MWTAPAAMFIEAAADGLKSADPKMLAAEVSEMSSFGTQRIQEVFGEIYALIGSDLNQAFDQCDPSGPNAITFTHGYLLGLQVARTQLAGNATLILKGIDPSSIL